VTYVDPIGSGQSRYYWLRHTNVNGESGPWNASSGILGQTATDVDHVLGVLEGEITESELATDLQGEIDKISGGINVAGSIAAQVASEATARGLAITAETTARGLAISAEATARSSAISAAVSGEASARASAITASADAIQSQINDITGVPPWNSSASYSISDTVHHDGKLFAAAAANSDSEPTFGGSPVASTNTDWTLTGDYVSLASVSQANSASITAINNISTDSSSAAAVAIKGLQTSKEDTGVAASAGHDWRSGLEQLRFLFGRRQSNFREEALSSYGLIYRCRTAQFKLLGC
jgi:predicted phage tail protein